MSAMVKASGEKVAELRIKRGLSQRDLADKANVSPSTINLTENDRTSLRPSTARRVAEALGVEVADLF